MNVMRIRMNHKLSRVIAIAVPGMLAAASLVAQPPPAPPPPTPLLSLTMPDGFNVCAGGQLRVKAMSSLTAAAGNVIWSVSLSPSDARVYFDHPDAPSTTFHVREDFPVQGATPVSAAISFKSGTTQGPSQSIQITPACDQMAGGEIVRAVVGFDQIGASGTPSSQSFAFDFYISRPLPWWNKKRSVWGSSLRWWGNVSVDSVPYTQNSTLANLASNFTSTFGSQNVNTLAQSLGFQTGPELRLWSSNGAYGSLTDASAGRFGLNLFAGVGATGPNNPSNNVTVFQAPAAGSAQASVLVKDTGVAVCSTGSATPCLTLCAAGATCSSNLALVPRSGDRFLQQWGTGLRLYTLFTDTNGKLLHSTPATVEFSIGQDASVTESHLHNFVGHVAATYPFSIGPRGDPKSVVIYLMGEVNSAFAKNHFQDTLTLTPALDANKNPVPINDPSVTQISVEANRRDIYRVGVGIDLISVWNAVAASNKPKTGSN